ncbi:hypothetical protein N0M98_00380 [Paenibacillus doosanensis]|uniref:Uncharacterized protein n=1 Tax=Paenibacillus konkukensis TaxID=2020716 RepID=A0ABY4RYW2_9BACL|nr:MULTISPECIES: hypothetical protein [Paenibacillus]MCS7458579.1 hypothetical protein [Paenibacillus doosanensis]UQZ86899.1 hypothetical protein SK3146_06192 [Paenibacillus konkukensis]
MIVLFILFILVMGSFFSGALVLFFQKKPKLGFLMLVLGLAATFLFYYSIYKGWVTVPQQS